MSNKVMIYTDGSCDNNTIGNGGYSVIIFDNQHPIKISGYVPNTTNQRMELTAVIEGMKHFTEPREIEIFSDSAYVCNCFNDKWYKRWVMNKWRNANGEPVANKDLWMEFIKQITFHSVKIHKVKGHSTNVFNNECDAMAKDIIQFYRKIKSMMK